MSKIRQILDRMRSYEGATAVEYAIMVALIAAVIIGAVVVLGNESEQAFNCTGAVLENSTTTANC